MQVLSQLSYNPTDSVGPLVGAVSVATRPGSSPGCSTGEFRAPRSAGSHHPGSLVNEARRVLLPRQRFAVEDSTGVRYVLNLGPRRRRDEHITKAIIGRTSKSSSSHWATTVRACDHSDDRGDRERAAFSRPTTNSSRKEAADGYLPPARRTSRTRDGGAEDANRQLCRSRGRRQRHQSQCEERDREAELDDLAQPEPIQRADVATTGSAKPRTRPASPARLRLAPPPRTGKTLQETRCLAPLSRSVATDNRLVAHLLIMASRRLAARRSHLDRVPIFTT